MIQLGPEISWNNFLDMWGAPFDNFFSIWLLFANTSLFNSDRSSLRDDAPLIPAIPANHEIPANATIKHAPMQLRLTQKSKPNLCPQGAFFPVKYVPYARAMRVAHWNILDA